MKKNKVLLIQGRIPNYRVEIFNELAKHVDLTVIYSEGNLPYGVNFTTMYIPAFKIRYRFHKKNIYTIANKFDVVICMHDFSYFYFKLLYLLPRKFKLIYWGIGVRSGYDCRYDCDNNGRFYNRIKKSLQLADALVFYSDYPKNKYAKLGVPDEKMFVANNTVKVLSTEPKEKDCILFVGSLYRQKKIFELLNNYYEAYKQNEKVYPLVIIGDGDDYNNVKCWIDEKRMNDKIILKGAIYDEKVLAEYFSSAIVCVSPDQAGLSVLKSMGYGVPFVTHKNAITGGEIFNVKHEINGLLLDDFSEIKNVVIDATENPQKFLRLGEIAKEHYDNYRTVEQMVNGFVSAIEYVLGKN